RACRIQTKLPPDFCSGKVPQFVRMPVWNSFFETGSPDRVSNGARIIPPAGLPFCQTLCPRDLRRLNRALAFFALASTEVFNGIAGREKEGFQVRLQVLPDNCLSPWPQGNHALKAGVLHLVMVRPIEPDGAAHVDVNSTHNANLAAAHAA